MKIWVKWYTPKISQKRNRISCSISSVIGVLSLEITGTKSSRFHAFIIWPAIVHQKGFSDLYFMRRNVFGGFSGCLTRPACTATLPLHLTLRPGLVHVFTRHLFHLEISLELRLKGMVPHKSWHTYLHHFHVHLSFKSKLHPSPTNTHL